MRKFSKIFGIGLSRTGTHSLSQALRQLGLTVSHFPESLAEIEANAASTDSRVADKFELLDQAFAGSLFVYTVRDLEAWLKSCERFWADFGQFAKSPELRKLHDRLYGSADFHREIYAVAYASHDMRVTAHFANRPNDLLRMDICGGDGWPQLAAFLDIPAPATPFPRETAPGGAAALKGG